MSRRKKKSRPVKEPASGAGAFAEPSSDYPEMELSPAAEQTGIEPLEESGPGRDAEDVRPAAPAEPVESELERARRDASAMRDLAQRKQAEFENYRKRVERERADFVRHAGFEVVKEVLPVLDNLERALRAADSGEAQLRAGVEIIHRQLQDILVRQGLIEIESLGKPFDPHLHQAVSHVETEEQPEDTVVEVFQKGYLFKDRLLRPAMVSVARAREGSTRGGAESGSEDPRGDEELLRRSE
jgi:molecular chaperone GrpE